jgi:hypothetical protein
MEEIMTDEQKPAGVAELAELLIEARFSYLQMARCLLDADVAVAGWSKPHTVARVIACKDRGCRILLEVSAEASGATTVALVTVSPAGKREQIDSVSDSAPGAAN